MRVIWVTIFTIFLFAVTNSEAAMPTPEMFTLSPHSNPRYPQPERDADSTHSYDALHLDIDLHPNIEDMAFTAEVTMTAVIMEDDLESIVMDNYVLSFDSVFVDDEEADYNSNASRLTITLPEGVENGDTIMVTVAYHGSIRANNDLGTMMYNQQRDNLYTFGQPYRTRGWVVCYDKPFDKVTSRMIVTLPSNYRVLSNGSLTSIEDIGDNMNRTVWTNDYPISTYLLSVCASPYTVIDLGTAGENDTPISLWAFPADSAAAMSSMGNTPEMLEYFENLFGPYPFSKYAVGESALNLNEEHQTCTTMQEAVVRGNDRFEWIVAHELAHQWWGDMVGPLTFDDIWLNEGFATYSNLMWMGREDNETFYAWMNQAAEQYFREDQFVRYAIYDPPLAYMFGSAIYNKGGWVMHMLRYLLGDEDFFAGWRAYGEAHAYGSAITSELQSAMEEASGIDLTNFFDQWVYRGGYPIYSITNYEVRDAEDGSFSVEFDLEQQQSRAPIYTLPLQFKFSNEVNDTTIQFEIAEEERQHLRVEGLSFEPTGFEFDPDNWVLSRFDDNTSVGDDWQIARLNFSLASIYPNPFNSTATIEYQVPYATVITLSVYNQLGQVVKTLVQGKSLPGSHVAAFNGAELPTGLYFIRLEGGRKVALKKVVLMR